jgi:hypothetical protein
MPHKRKSPKKRTQKGKMEKARANIAGGNLAMLDLLYGPNPISDDELRVLIKKRPEVYSRFSEYLGKR